MDAEPRNIAAEVPFPPRRRWLRRLGAAVIMLLVALVLLRVVAGFVTSRRLEAEIERIRTAGHPLLAEDFPPAEVAEEDNAALLYQQAIRSWVTPGPSLTWMRGRGMPVEDGQFLANNAVALRLVRRARSKPACDWGGGPPHPMNQNNFRFGQHRMLAMNLGDTAVSLRRRGRHDEAVETIRDMFAMARNTAAPPTTIVSQLVAVSQHALGAERVESLGPSLDAGTDTSARRIVAVLIDELLHDRYLLDGMKDAYISERASMLAMSRDILDGRMLFPGGRGWTAGMKPSWRERSLIVAVAPFFRADMARMLRFQREVLEQMDRWGESAEIRSSVRLAFENYRSPFMSLTRGTISSMGSAIKSTLITVARRRMAAIALACRLYELDHGARPSRLSDLVPGYISMLPSDPFDPEGHTFRYLPGGTGTPVAEKPADTGLGRPWPMYADAAVVESSEKDRRPILYSVGADGVDDRCRNCFGIYGDWNSIGLDVPFLLVASSEETVDQERSVEPDGGDGAEDDGGETEP